MKTVCFVFITILLSACTYSPKANMTDALNDFIDEMKLDVSDYKSILFIPLEGCGSCIMKGIDFFKENVQNADILFVMCTHKPFAYEYLKKIDTPNVVIDNKNIAMRYRILSTAPIAYKRNGECFDCLGVTSDGFNFYELY